MKKLLALMIAMGSISAVFAQSGYDHNRYDSRDQSRNVVLGRDDRGNQTRTDAYAYPSQRNDNRYDNRSNNQYGNRYDDRRRQEEIDRLNYDHDRRINDYRNDRSLNVYERNRRIDYAERERQGKLKSFVGGAAVGAVAGVLLGVLIGH
jgi:hypothetical protein